MEVRNGKKRRRRVAKNWKAFFKILLSFQFFWQKVYVLPKSYFVIIKFLFIELPILVNFYAIQIINFTCIPILLAPLFCHSHANISASTFLFASFPFATFSPLTFLIYKPSAVVGLIYLPQTTGSSQFQSC